jgi:hypothetical protein
MGVFVILNGILYKVGRNVWMGFYGRMDDAVLWRRNDLFTAVRPAITFFVCLFACLIVTANGSFLRTLSRGY